MKYILGKKIEMIQIWQGDNVIAVTKVQAGPCPIVQIKTKGKDGYEAIQIGSGEKKKKNIAKPQIGHQAKVKNLKIKTGFGLRYLREFRSNEKLEIGDIITVDTFKIGDKINVIGFSKGRGFQGVVKRHGFHGQDKTHGHKDQNRMPGSIGATDPQRVFKGLRMGGHMGNERITIKNTEIIKIDSENNILYIKGGVPGARNSLVEIVGNGELKIVKPIIDNKDNKKEDKENNTEK